ncbi:MAG: hypothetical protein JJU05_04710 [Verrucomicrobia bacterium]|nr:hypothetical protein [Verrucomicrobiota bacterium]MCH8526852.1 hypothetical protein [Kiritimatiellia bacterium]
MSYLLPFVSAQAEVEELPESWVHPPPDREEWEPERHAFTPNEFAPLISMGEDGRLHYRPYTEKGDTLMDWSYTGYKNSRTPIPDVPVAVTLSPLPGEAVRIGDLAYPMGPDSRGLIQAAIDEVAALPADDNGIRGAVLLKRGAYTLEGGLIVRSGVVLRGEGDGDDGTVLIFRSAEGGGDAVLLGDPEGKIEPVGEADAVRITDAYLPSGSRILSVADAGQFAVGDFVQVRKTPNQAWIDTLGVGQRLRHIRGGRQGANKTPWRPGAFRFAHLRQIEAIEGNTLTLDGVLPQSFDQEHGSGDVYKVDVSSLATHSGVESLSIVSNYDTTVEGNDRSTNYINFRNGIAVRGTYDSWVRGVTVKHVFFAAVQIGHHTRQITVRDTNSLAPVGPVRGGFRYAFNISGGTLHLFYNCYSEDSRHCFSLGSRQTGPFAFVRSTAVRGGLSEPHHRWSTGALYDNVITRDGSLGALNRGDSGTGHGWAAANTMFWNCDAGSIVVMNPETEGENNFAIGFRGEYEKGSGTGMLYYSNTRAGYWGTPKEGKYFGCALMGSGHIESPDRPVSPDSLFEQQLIEHLGAEQAAAVLK